MGTADTGLAERLALLDRANGQVLARAPQVAPRPGAGRRADPQMR